MSGTEFRHDVVDCSRCGEDHRDLVFVAFDHPVAIGGIKIGRWSSCPTTGDPILMQIEPL